MYSCVLTYIHICVYVYKLERTHSLPLLPRPVDFFTFINSCLLVLAQDPGSMEAPWAWAVHAEDKDPGHPGWRLCSLRQRLSFREAQLPPFFFFAGVAKFVIKEVQACVSGSQVVALELLALHDALMARKACGVGFGPHCLRCFRLLSMAASAASIVCSQDMFACQVRSQQRDTLLRRWLCAQRSALFAKKLPNAHVG